MAKTHGRQQDEAVFDNTRRYTTPRGVPALLTEFGATNDLANLTGVLQRADADRIGWLEWAYTGNDKTSASPTEQALVFDTALPPFAQQREHAQTSQYWPRPTRRVVAGAQNIIVVRIGHLPAVSFFNPASSPPQPVLARRADAHVGASISSNCSGYHPTVTGGRVVSAPKHRSGVDRGGRVSAADARRRRTTQWWDAF